MERKKIIEAVARIRSEFNAINEEYEIAVILSKSKKYSGFRRKCLDLIIASLVGKICKILESTKKSTSNINIIAEKIFAENIPIDLKNQIEILNPLYLYLKSFRDKNIAHMDYDIISDGEIDPMPEILVTNFDQLKQLSKLFVSLAEEKLQVNFRGGKSNEMIKVEIINIFY